MKHKLTIFHIALAFASCAAPAPIPPSPISSPVATLTPPPTPSLTPERTATPILTATALPSDTPIPIQSPTAINTEIAPEDVGVCPVENPDLKPEFSLDWPPEDGGQLLTLEPSLDFLNRGGTVEALYTFFRQSDWPFYKGDLTGDGIAEIGLRDESGTRFYILGCIGQKYVVLDYYWFPGSVNPQVRLIKDLNLNNIPDIVFFAPSFCGFQPVLKPGSWNGIRRNFKS